MSCSQTLVGIQQDCHTSQGGIVKAWLTNYADGIFTVGVNASGDTAVSAVSSAVTFYEYNFHKGTGSMTSTLNIDDANGINYVSTEVVLQFNRQETAKRTGVAALALGGLAGIVLDGNGKYWAIGISEPVNATAGTAQTGTAKTDGNFYQITLTDDYESFPVEVPSDVFATITIAQ